ncbi:hypothetical protein [Streptomyces humi]
MPQSPAQLVPDAPATPPAGDTPDWTGFADTVAAVEHEHGVLPLLGLFDTDPEGLAAGVRAGRLRASLGLFTANARFSAAAAPLTGVRRAGHVALSGRVRYGDPRAEVTVAAVRLEEELRLVLLAHTLPGVRHGPYGERGWLLVDDARLSSAVLSRPVSLAPAGGLAAPLDTCAWHVARHAAHFSARLLADLRRRLAATGAGKDALSTSQYTAHEISRLEIEVSLAAAAADHGPGFRTEGPGGQAVGAVLLACGDVLRRTHALVAELEAELGLPDGPRGAGEVSRALAHGLLGGRRMAEGELAHRMGLTTETVRLAERAETTKTAGVAETTGVIETTGVTETAGVVAR